MRNRCAAIVLLAITAQGSALAQPAPPASAAQIIQPGDRVYGNPHGRITIVDFYDTSCGPCRVLNRRIERLIAHDHNVRYVPIDVPILGWQSALGARALLAAGRQHRFLPMLDTLMAQRRLPTPQLMRADATRLALDPHRFARDIASPTTARLIDAALKRAATLNIDEVPVVYIGRNRIPGAMSYNDLRDLVAHPDQRPITRIAEAEPAP